MTIIKLQTNKPITKSQADAIIASTGASAVTVHPVGSAVISPYHPAHSGRVAPDGSLKPAGWDARKNWDIIGWGSNRYPIRK